MKKCVGIAAILIAAAPLRSSPPRGRPVSLTASCLVATTSGDVQGVDNGSSCAFLGIPFAAPPIGGLRWKPPQPASPWTPATLNATVAPPNCATGTLGIGNEDCLKLNIWTPDPAPAVPAPVLVGIHTGAFLAASANFPASNGRRLAELTGAIVVAANYRLGPFGFLGHRALTAEDPAYRSSGNYGLLDQRAALAWVRDNIAAFGGDPENVTIGGQSAGAHSVGLHVVSPRSAGYFRRAIMHSGYASTRWRTLADAESVGDDFAAALGCTNPSEALACMRGKDRNQVLLAHRLSLAACSDSPKSAPLPGVRSSMAWRFQINLARCSRTGRSTASRSSSDRPETRGGSSSIAAFPRASPPSSTGRGKHGVRRGRRPGDSGNVPGRRLCVAETRSGTVDRRHQVCFARRAGSHAWSRGRGLLSTNIRSSAK